MRWKIIIISCIVLLCGILLRSSPQSNENSDLPPWPVWHGITYVSNFVEKFKEFQPPAVRMLGTLGMQYELELLRACVELNIIEILRTPKTCSQVAKELGTAYEPFVCRLLNSATKYGLLTENNGVFNASDYGRTLDRQNPDNMYSVYEMITSENLTPFIVNAVKTGKEGWQSKYGEDFWTTLSKNPARSTYFDKAMAFYTKMSLPVAFADVGFDQCNRVCDLGGGEGALVIGILERFPNKTGTVIDLPRVVEKTNKRIKEHNLESRMNTVGGSFLESIPELDQPCDCVFLSAILHDWSDETCQTILRNAKKILNKNGKVIAIEQVLDTSSNIAFEKLKTCVDMTMMSLLEPGARQRTVDEHRKLFASVGLNLTNVYPTRSPMDILEATLTQ